MKHFFVCEIYSVIDASVLGLVFFFVIIDKDIFYGINTTACEADGKDTTVVS